MKTLFKQAESFTATYDPVTSFWEFQPQGSGWTLDSFTANNFSCSYRGYFDLAGLSMDEKTLFFRDIQIQMQTLPNATNGVVGDNATIVVYVTDQPMDDFDFIGPGFAYSKMNAENCLIMRT